VWRNLILFLNVFSVSTVLCSLSSRFIYPQLSLEGHAFWLIGLAPTTARRVVAAKFGLALASMLAVSTGLMWLSTEMLKMTPLMTVIALALAIAVSLAASGLSVGLGAVFLDLRHRNPAAIVSGFGGTLNLVLSIGFMLAAILPFGFLFHVYFLYQLAVVKLHHGLLAAGVWLLLITALATVLPLRLGARSLAGREF
jgi:ABC-2 type transport system permease protein